MCKKKILFLGGFYLSDLNINELLKEMGIDSFDLEFIRDFDKIKKRFSYRNYGLRKYEVIIVGQVPHKTHGTGNGRSLASDTCTRESEVPVYVCRNEVGVIKATKETLSKVLKAHFKKDFINNLITA